MTARSRWPWAVGYAVATFLAFPHPIGDSVLDLGWLAGFASPAVILLGLRGLVPREALKLGFAAGLLAQAAILHWLYIVTVDYGRAPWPLGFAGPLGLGAYSAMFVAAFAALWSWLGERGRASPLAAAVLWTLSDHLRTFVFTGFPWAVIGYSQHRSEPLLAWVAYTGVYGLSFACALGGAILAAAIAAWRDGSANRDRLQLAVAVGVFAVLWGVAAVLPRVPADEGGETVRVAVLQGNIEQGVKWSPAWRDRTLAIYEDLSARAAADGAQIVVFPETAVPGDVRNDPRLRFRLAELARRTGVAHVIGAVAIEDDPGPRPPRVFDSAFLVQPSGEWSDRYDKSHLVPWGEYIPFQAILGRVLKAVAQGMASHGVTPGPGPRAVSITTSTASVTAGVPICYELLFPDLVRRFVDGGGELLLAITNDAWYGRTGAPHQFLAITAVRSAENGVWTARAANTGVSAIIDARGRVRQATRIFERDLIVADVPLRPASLGGTFYTRHGDLFVYACWLAAVALALAARFRPVAHTGAPPGSRIPDDRNE